MKNHHWLYKLALCPLGSIILKVHLANMIQTYVGGRFGNILTEQPKESKLPMKK